MKFSIVTPTFNQNKYIETTIRSVLANKQNYPDVEYIIVDGGSNDGTQDIVNNFSSEIDVFISEPDEGQADAINKGFKYATGHVYAFINSDDYYYPDTFQKVAKVFAENPDIDVVYGDCVFVTEDEQFFRYFTEIEEFDSYRLTSCSDFIMQPACFWRKGIHDKCIEFNKYFHFGFDWDMWCRMLKADGKFFYLKELLAANREFAQTKTSSGGVKRLKELKKINILHKQSILLTAYHSYSYALYRTYKNNYNEKLKKIVHRWLSFQNIFYNKMISDKKDLYGIIEHTNFLKKNSMISFPFYKKDKKVYVFIGLSNDKITNQLVKIQINGVDFGEYQFNYHQCFVVLKLDILLPEIEIKFCFAEEIEPHFRIRDFFKLSGRKYAAEIILLKIIPDNFEDAFYEFINKRSC